MRSYTNVLFFSAPNAILRCISLGSLSTFVGIFKDFLLQIVRDEFIFEN